MDVTLALDIGGTKIAAGLVDADGHAGCIRPKLPTPDGDARSGVGRWSTTFGHRGLWPRPVDACSASASPPPVRSTLPAGTVSPINITEWQRFPIVERGYRR